MNVRITLAALLLGSCGGAATESALADFESSSCKQHENATMVPRAAAADYEGMTCVVWEPVGENMRVDLFNFDGACGAEWETAEATVDGDEVTLRVINPSGSVAACGSCMYDWSFEVIGMPQTGTVTLTVLVDAVPGLDDPRETVLELPLDEMPAGARCQYADAWGTQMFAELHGLCGRELMPCRVVGMDDFCLCSPCVDPPVPCEAGLECAENVCHAPCQADDTCGPGRSCQAGLCRPTNGW